MTPLALPDPSCVKPDPFSLHKMQSRTEHVWPEHVKALRKELAEYKRHKKMTGELIDLSIELSKAKVACLREKSTGQKG